MKRTNTHEIEGLHQTRNAHTPVEHKQSRDDGVLGELQLGRVVHIRGDEQPMVISAIFGATFVRLRYQLSFALIIGRVTGRCTHHWMTSMGIWCINNVPGVSS